MDVSIRLFVAMLVVGIIGACDRDPGASGADITAPGDAQAEIVSDASDNPRSCELPPDSEVVLPRDDAAHDEAIEWWYWTGHLEDDEGRWYGVQITFFVFAMGPVHAILSNVALSDLEGGVFHRTAKFDMIEPTKMDDGFDFTSGPHRAQGGGGVDSLHAEVDGVVIDLELIDERGPVAQHGDGYHEYLFGGYTFYYSRPSMTASGTLDFPDGIRQVQGGVWFDHQWGDLELATEYGWDWFALNLDDGRELMLFIVHAPEGDTLVGGTLRDPDCVVSEIAPAEVSIEVLGFWESPNTGCTYPSGWQLDVAGLHLTVTPSLLDQEMVAPQDMGKTYWEGAATVDGDVTGRAYVELAGYCSH